MPDSMSDILADEDPPGPGQWLTIREVAKLLRVSRDTVERWIHAGQLRAIDVSRRAQDGSHRAHWRVSSRGLKAFVEARANRSALPKRAKPRPKKPGLIEFIK